MMNFKERILPVYFMVTESAFYVYLFGVLSFGKAFLVLHVDMFPIPIFITEIFLLLNIPLLFCKYKYLTRLPKLFLKLISFFFVFGCFYLFLGALDRNPLALRDVTLSLYILFLPISLIHLSDLKKIKLIIAVIILANLINLYVGLSVLLNIYPQGHFCNFISQAKLTNLGLYYGFASAFIISFYDYIKPKAYRLLSLILLSSNLCMVIIFCKRSLWIAIFVLFVFLACMLKRKFLRLFPVFVPVFIITYLTISYFGSKVAPEFIEKSVSNKIKGSYLFLNNTPLQSQSVETPSNPNPLVVNAPIKSKPLEAATSGDSFINIIWRINIWKQTLVFAMESPIIGKGFGVYPEYKIWGGVRQPVDEFINSGVIPAHNQFITVFLKMGILGLGLFLFMNIYVFVYGLSYLRKCNSEFINNLLIASLGIFIFWHFFAFFFDIIDSPPTNIFLWVIMGMIFAAVEIDKN